jgi:hypothetical protein
VAAPPIGGGIGRLPNEPTRKRMAELIDSLTQAKPLIEGRRSTHHPEPHAGREAG